MRQTIVTRTHADAARARNSAVPHAFAGGLRIGEANDVHEQEADRVANDVMTGGPTMRHW